jgi:hypothetical protein
MGSSSVRYSRLGIGINSDGSIDAVVDSGNRCKKPFMHGRYYYDYSYHTRILGFSLRLSGLVLRKSCCLLEPISERNLCS